MKLETPVTARAIINIIGKPKEHIESTLREYVDKLKNEKGVNVTGEYYAEAAEEKHKSMFSTFAELEIKFSDTSKLIWFCFDYMPASIEIIEPETIQYNCVDFTSFLNDLQDKLHRLDMLIKNFDADNKILKKNAMTLLKNIIRLSLKQGAVDIKVISREAGVPVDHIQQFLDAMIKEGQIKKIDDKYVLV